MNLSWLGSIQFMRVEIYFSNSWLNLHFLETFVHFRSKNLFISGVSTRPWYFSKSICILLITSHNIPTTLTSCVGSATWDTALQFGLPRDTRKLICCWTRALLDAPGKIMQAEGICHTSPKPTKALQHRCDHLGWHKPWVNHRGPTQDFLFSSSPQIPTFQ